MFGLFRRNRSHLRDAIDSFLRSVPAEAPIRSVFASDDIEQQLRAFDRADARALRKQQRYGGAAVIARWAGVLGLVVVPLELLAFPLWPSLSNVTYPLHALVLMLTFFAVILLGLRRSALQWKQARVEAEKVRGEVFERILQAGAQHNALVDALECFKVAHLNSQIAFYAKRMCELPERIRKELSLVTPFRLMGYGLSGIAGFIGFAAVLRYAADLGWSPPYLSAFIQLLAMTDAIQWHYGVKATAMSLLAFAGARLLSHEDLSNSVLYPWAKQQLQRLTDTQLPQAERAAAQGNLDAVLVFRNEVQAILNAESGAWGSGSFIPPA